MQLSAAVDAYFLTLDLTPKSRRWYGSKLTYFLKWCAQQDITEVAQLNKNHVYQFVAHLRITPSERYGRLMSSHTLHGYVRGIKSFLNWCVGDDLLSEKVTRKIAMPKRDEKVIAILSPDYITRLYAAAGQPDKRYPWFVDRDRAILAVLLDTGIRANELCDLTLDRTHLTADDAYILVNGKGRKQREVGLGIKSRQLLHRYIHRSRPTSTYHNVFLTRASKPLGPEGLDRILYRIRDKASITDMGCAAHTYRHTFAVNYLKAGGDVYKLSRLLGHTSVVITENYLRAFKSRDARVGPSVFDVLRA